MGFYPLHDLFPVPSQKFPSKTASFDGAQISGPPVAASDWDGSDGLTLPQLWDTHTHIVEIANNPSQVDIVSTNGDCLVPVAFVLDAE